MADTLVEHQALVDALLRQATDRGLSPVLVGTGISSVLLIGEHAYKLRKPLKLDFLDFSSLAQRRLDCEAELKLNRRTAPDLYLDVVAVQGPPGAPWFSPAPAEDPVLDWALRMRRFDPEACFDRLAARGHLTPHQIESLATQVGQFHLTLPPSPAAFDEPFQTLEWAQNNLHTLLVHRLSQPWHARLDVLADWTLSTHTQLAPLMAARQAAGWVREGHGDLHLGNVLWHHGQAQLFDAIEFNEALRHLDVISDFSFVWMDLHRHGLPLLAAQALNVYLNTLGDGGGLPLLRWHAVYRALVRAKVALLQAEQSQAMGQDGQRDLQAMERCIALAEHLRLAPAKRPLLVVTTGLSGSGKSTVAARLVGALGAVCLRSDVVRKRLFGLSPLARGGASMGLYDDDATQRTYARLDTLSRQALEAGWPVIVDAACLKRQERDHFRQLARECAADFVLLNCAADESMLRMRIAQRAAAGHDASDADVGILERQLQWHDPVLPEEAACHVRTDRIH